MHSYTTIRALQEERYLRPAQQRPSVVKVGSHASRLRQLLSRVAGYRLTWTYPRGEKPQAHLAQSVPKVDLRPERPVS